MNKLRVATVATALALVVAGVGSEFTLAFSATAPPGSAAAAGFAAFNEPASEAPSAAIPTPDPSAAPAPPASQRPVQPTGGPTMTTPPADPTTAPVDPSTAPATDPSTAPPAYPPPAVKGYAGSSGYALDGALIYCDMNDNCKTADGKSYVYDARQGGYVPA